MNTDTVTLVHLDPWLDDGNIVLAAEGKAFRVHRGVLSSFSGVFRDMFACPHSDTLETALIEGCPVVYLHDAATDIQIILRALYDSEHMYPCCRKMPFSVAAAFLRLGKKYDFPHLFSTAEERVRYSMEPTTTSIVNLSERAFQFKAPDRNNLCKGIVPSDPYNIQLINLLRETELTAYLPILMYQCVLHSPVHPFVNGYQLEDGSSCSLSPPNLRSYILVTDIFKRFGTQLLTSLTSARGDCTRVTCADNMHRLWSDSLKQPFEPWRSERFSFQPSNSWDAWFCSSCKTTMRSARDAAVRKVWEELPTACGFASWEEVKKVVKYGRVFDCHRGL